MGTQNKLLKPLDGRPLLAHALARVDALGLAQTLVIAGDSAAAVRPLVPPSATLLRNPHANEGMGRSIACAAPSIDAGLTGIFIVLGDMPFVKLSDYEKLAAALSLAGDASICVPVHDGRRGHPVLFGRRHFAELATLGGDMGARALLGRNSALVREVEGCSGGILIDLDDEHAFLTAEERLRQSSSGC